MFFFFDFLETIECNLKVRTQESVLFFEGSLPEVFLMKPDLEKIMADFTGKIFKTH